MTHMTDTPTSESTGATALRDAKTFIDIFRSVGFEQSYSEFEAGVSPEDASVRSNIKAFFEPGGKLDVLPHDISTPITLIFGAVTLFIAAAKLVDDLDVLDGPEAEFLSGIVGNGFLHDDFFASTFIVATLATLTADTTGNRTVVADIVSKHLADADPQKVAESALTALIVGSLAVHVLDTLHGFVDGV